MTNTDLKQFVDYLKSRNVNLSEEQAIELAKQLEKDFSYVPKIGIFGKTGAGKSSLVNAIFGKDVCPVSDVEACTREIKEQNVGGLVLVDCPGIAESKERDQEYFKLYNDLIPQLDAIIWVLQGDNRSYAPDLEFYDLIKEQLKTVDGRKAPFFMAVNQVDKIEPFREWDVEMCQPGPKQAINITKKVTTVAGLFEIASNHVIPVSAVERYNLASLISALLYELPANQALIASVDINKKLKEEEEKRKAEDERRQKEHMELMAKLERERKDQEEAEKLRQKEHEAKMEALRRQEEQAREEEKRRIEEEKRRLEEEKQRQEAYRRQMENERRRREQKALEEESKRIERKKKDEEERRRIEKAEKDKKKEYEKNFLQKTGDTIDSIGKGIPGPVGSVVSAIGKGLSLIGGWFK